MKNIKVSELKVGNIFALSLIRPLESYIVESIIRESVWTMSRNSKKQKEFKTDQEKLIILLKES